MSGYTKDIVELLGCNEQDAVMIEYIMREHIFHSTLDWQSRSQFNSAARKASRMLSEDRETYEEVMAAGRAAYSQLRAENEARATAQAYEI